MRGDNFQILHNEEPKRRKNNFRSAIVYVVLLIILVSVILYTYYYFTFSNYAKEKMLQSTQNLTESISFSITEMNTSIQNLCISLTSLSDVQHLMHTQDPDAMESNQTITKLQYSVNSTPNIHSVLIYNRGLDKTFSSYRGISDVDYEVRTILNDSNTKPLTPTPRILNKEGYYSSVPVFSYIMNDINYKYGEPSALIVNVSADWLNSSLKTIVPPDARLIIFDKNLRLLASSNATDSEFLTSVSDHYNSLINVSAPTVLEHNGAEMIATATPINGTDWYLVYETPYNALLKDAHKLEMNLLAFSLLVFSIAIAAAVWVVYNIYKPIKNIAQNLQTHVASSGEALNEDDLTYISRTVQMVSQQYQDIKTNNIDIIHENLVRSALLGTRASIRDTQINPEEAQQVLTELLSCTMILLRVDNVALLTNLSYEQRRQINETLQGIVRSVVPSLKKHGLINVSPGEYIVLFDYPNKEDLGTFLERLNLSIVRESGLSFSLFWEKMFNPGDLHERYVSLQQISRYRIFNDPCCCMDETLYRQRRNLPLYYPEDLINSIKFSVKNNNEEDALHFYEKYSEEIKSRNNYDNYRFCVMQLFFHLQTLLDEMQSYAIADAKIDIDEVFSAISHAEQVSQIDMTFSSLITSMCATKTSLNKKHSIVLESVKEYINLHYNDKELSLKMISSEFNLSQSYLGKMFRESYGASVKEYITQVRLKVAAEYLAKSSFSIKKIMDLCGFDNESNFYRIFRSNYGVTPSSYRLGSSIHRSKVEENNPDD